MVFGAGLTIYILHCALYYHALLYHTTTHHYHEYGTILLVISSFRFLKQCIHWGSPSSIRFHMGLPTFFVCFLLCFCLHSRATVLAQTSVFSETAAWIQTGSYLSTISPDHLFFFFQDFKFSNCHIYLFFYFFFVFINMGPYGSQNCFPSIPLLNFLKLFLNFCLQDVCKVTFSTFEVLRFGWHGYFFQLGCLLALHRNWLSSLFWNLDRNMNCHTLYTCSIGAHNEFSTCCTLYS